MKRLEGAAVDEYSRDAGILQIVPKAVVIADDERDVVEAIGKAKAENVPVTPRGSGTSIPSQSVGSGLVLLQKGRKVEMVGKKVRVEPAVTKAELNAVLTEEGRWMPVDPSSYRVCSLGGMVSNNSSGARTFKYGSTIDFVNSLRVFLPEEGIKDIRPVPIEEALSYRDSTGRVARLLVENQKEIERERPKVTKNSSGYRLERVIHDGLLDLPKLFVGSEGTLGVITSIELLTVPKRERSGLVIVECGLRELDRVVLSLRKLKPAAVELVDKSVFRKTGRSKRLEKFPNGDEDFLVFCEFDGSEEEVSAAIVSVSESEVAQLGPMVLTDSAQIAEAWEVRNETLLAAGEMRNGRRVPVPGVEDLVVPTGALGDLIDLLTGCFTERGLDFISYGHAGDANLHMRPLLDPSSREDRAALHDIMENCFEKVWRLGGSMSGEHGDGMLRAEFLERQYRETYWIMREIKQIYDPGWLLNPGVKIRRF